MSRNVTVLRFVILMASVLAAGYALAETIISKDDADRIFGMIKPQWEDYVRKVKYPPTWKAVLSQHDTGTGIIAFDRQTGYGLSIQPLYSDVV